MIYFKLFYLLLASCVLPIFIAMKYLNLPKCSPPSNCSCNYLYWEQTQQWLPNFSYLSYFSLNHSHTDRPKQQNKPNCSPLPHAGIVFVPTSPAHINDTIRQRFQMPSLGGVWAPHHCRSVQKVAILVPYHNRSENLLLFSHHMHHFLQQQQLEYGIFMVEQMDDKLFNRAKLFNVGFWVLQMLHAYDCYMLHDIDKVPEDTSFLYHCNDKQPKHMLHLLRKAILPTEPVQKRPPPASGRYYSAHFHKSLFGGVSAMTKDQFLSINGMSNNIWGWGGEDDELYCRIISRGFKPIISKNETAKFVILHHLIDSQRNMNAVSFCREVATYMDKDGLNSLNYELLGVELRPLYTKIKAYL